MKKITLLLTLATLLIGCSKESSSTGEEQNIGFGRVEISAETFASVETTDTRSSVSTYTIPEELYPTNETLSIKISGTYIDSDDNLEKEYNYSYATLKAYNTADIDSDGNLLPPYIPAGTYTFTLTSTGDISTESATNAFFSGSAVDVVVEARIVDTEISIPISLQNSILRLDVTEDFTSYFEGGASLTLSTESGSTLYYNYPDNSANEGAVLYVAPQTKLYLEGSATKQSPTENPDDAPTVTFSKSELSSTTTAATMSTVTVDATDAGGSSISVSVDGTITEISNESFELNPLN
ncbi:MAG: hypothetical protein R3Y16_02745 [Rikenellaceae bacterium]